MLKVDFDFSAGDDYWQRSADFWSIVREEWQRIIDSRKRFSLKDEVKGRKLFMPFFDYAEQLKADKPKQRPMRQFVRDTLKQYLE